MQTEPRIEETGDDPSARLIVTLEDDHGGSITFQVDPGYVLWNLPEEWHGRATKLLVQKGPAFVKGDHVYMLATPQLTNTDQIVIDPDLHSEDGVVLDLGKIDQGFRSRIQAFNPILNPNPLSPDFVFARALLFNKGDSVNPEWPSIVLYPFDGSGSVPRTVVDLEQIYFSKKIHTIIVDRLNTSNPNGTVSLFDVDSGQTKDLKPNPTLGTPIDLHAIGWQDRATDLNFIYP
jgi:hypothetical protein